MNDIADRMQLIEINYYASGKFLGVTLSSVYPNYREGDTIELQLDPTPRDRVRAPQKIYNKFYIVERVHHIIEERNRDTEYLDMKVDVMLTEAPDVDGDERFLGT